MKKREFIGVIVLFSLLRVILVSVMGLMPQDAYYCYYSDHLALSYFDHPPMIACMLKLFVSIFGKSALTLHVADFIVTSGTLYIFYLFLRHVLHGDDLKKAFTLIATAPFITILCINSTPDVPLLFFWSLSLLLIYRAVTSNRWHYWLLGGLASGCAFDSKYTALFLAFGLFLFLLCSQEHRRKLLSWKFLLFLTAFLAAILPVIIWNVQNDFISLKYQSTERASTMSDVKIEPQLFLGYFGSQLLLALPLFFLVIFRASFSTIKRFCQYGRLEEKPLFAASFALPFFLFFTAISFVFWVKINWIMPVYLSAAVLSVVYFKTAKFIRWQTGLSIFIHIVAIIELAWMPFPVNSDDTWWGWDKLADKVKTVANAHPGYFVFSDDSYKTAAALNFYLPAHVYAGNIVEQHAFQFALNDRNLQTLTGQNAIYVTSELSQRKRAGEGTIVNRLRNYFTTVQPLDTIQLKETNGTVKRKFFVFECHNYRPPVNKKIRP